VSAGTSVYVTCVLRGCCVAVVVVRSSEVTIERLQLCGSSAEAQSQ
jgi:hypothetical protein